MTAAQEPEQQPGAKDGAKGLQSSVRADLAAPGGGRVVTMGFPGLVKDAAGRRIEAAQMAATLDDPAVAGAALLLVLVEPGDVPAGALGQLQAACDGRGIRVAYLPIRDYDVPGQRFAAGWAGVGDEVRATLAAGGKIALSCHYGAGRSGMIAAALLVDQGLPLEQAVQTIRAQFPDSIETEAQMAWLEARAAARG